MMGCTASSGSLVWVLSIKVYCSPGKNLENITEILEGFFGSLGRYMYILKYEFCMRPRHTHDQDAPTEIHSNGIQASDKPFTGPRILSSLTHPHLHHHVKSSSGKIIGLNSSRRCELARRPWRRSRRTIGIQSNP